MTAYLTAYLHAIVALIAAHPNWAGVAAYLAALVEGIVLIGGLIPGATVIVSIGALVTYGGVSLWPLILWAAAGALTGDGLSFWLGYTHNDRIRGMWPFATRPQLIAGGEAFFKRHGGWSILIGRFVPPARAVVPVVAGLMRMPPLRFLSASAITALIWATTHILTGLLAGYALIGIGTVSRRLVVALGLFALGLVVVVFVVRLGISLGLKTLPHARTSLLAWARGHGGRLAHVTERTLAPEHSEFRAFVILNAVLIAAFAGFASLVEQVASEAAVARFDHGVSHFVQTLRTTWTDHVMLVPTMLGDWQVTTAVAVAGCAALLWYRRFRLAGGMAVALISTMTFVEVMKRLVHASRPIDIYSGADAFSFPSGHATMTATLYGLIGLIAYRGLGGTLGRSVIGACASFIGAVALSRVYLAAHWPSDVAGGVLFGVGITAGFALMFRNDAVPQKVAAWFLAAAAAALVIAGTWHVASDFSRDLDLYARQARPPLVLAKGWRDGGWRHLPAYRIDVAGEREEPLVLQWRGTPARLVEDLTRLGWSQPQAWSLASLNLFAYPHETAAALPVVPRFNDGTREVVAMIQPGTLGGIAGRYVLRAWPRAVRGGDGQVSDILIASIDFERVIHPLNELSLPMTLSRAACDTGPLLAGLSGAQTVGEVKKAPDGGCGGRLVLAGT